MVVVVERPMRVLLLRVVEPLLLPLLAVTGMGSGSNPVLQVGQLDRGWGRPKLGADERLAEVGRRAAALLSLLLLDPQQDRRRRAAHLSLLVLRVHEDRGLPQLLGSETTAEVGPHLGCGIFIHVRGDAKRSLKTIEKTIEFLETSTFPNFQI